MKSYPQRLESRIGGQCLEHWCTCLEARARGSLHQKHLGECTAEDCIGCDASQLDDTQSPAGICTNHEKNPSQF